MNVLGCNVIFSSAIPDDTIILGYSQENASILKFQAPPKEPAKDCLFCKGTGAMDSGGVTPWGDEILIPCDCMWRDEE